LNGFQLLYTENSKPNINLISSVRISQRSGNFVEV